MPAISDESVWANFWSNINFRDLPFKSPDNMLFHSFQLFEPQVFNRKNINKDRERALQFERVSSLRCMRKVELFSSHLKKSVKETYRYNIRLASLWTKRLWKDKTSPFFFLLQFSVSRIWLLLVRIRAEEAADISSKIAGSKKKRIPDHFSFLKPD